MLTNADFWLAEAQTRFLDFWHCLKDHLDVASLDFDYQNYEYAKHAH